MLHLSFCMPRFTLNVGWNDNSCFRELRVLCRTTCYLPVLPDTGEEQLAPEILGPVLVLLFLGILIVFLIGLHRVQGLYRKPLATQRSSRRPSDITNPRTIPRSIFLRTGEANFSISSVGPPLVDSRAIQPLTVNQQSSAPTSNVQEH